MANHNLPTITSTYTNFITELDARLDDTAIGFDPAFTTATNLATNAIRWTSAGNKWEKWSGSAWGDLSSAYAINISGNAATVTNGLYSSSSYSNPSWLTALAGTKITGSVAKADALTNIRTINGVNFDGSANITITSNTTNAITFNNAGSGDASGTTFNGSVARTISYNTVGAPSTTGTNATGTWGINISGNAATATVASSTLSATKIVNSGGWNITPTGTKLYFNYNGVNVGVLDSSGNLTVLGDVISNGTVA